MNNIDRFLWKLAKVLVLIAVFAGFQWTFYFRPYLGPLIHWTSLVPLGVAVIAYIILVIYDRRQEALLVHEQREYHSQELL